MKNAMLFLLLAICFAPLVSINAQDQQSQVMVPHISAPPVIDGEMDRVWYFACEHILEKYETDPPDDWFDLFASWRMLTDREKIYIFFYCMDDQLVDAHEKADEMDGVEFYFDANNYRTLNRFDGKDDIMIRINHGYGNVEDLTFGFGGGKDWGFNPEGIEFKIKDFENPTRWQMEIAIPRDSLKAEWYCIHEFGFEVRVNDKDGGVRETIAKWNSSVPGSSLNPRSWGTCSIDNTFLAYWDSTNSLPVFVNGFEEIVIDGEMDLAWNWIPEFSCNTWISGSDTPLDLTTIYDWYQNYFKFRLCSDAERIYGIVDVWNDTPYCPSDPPDFVELYFDGDNSKTSGAYDGFDDIRLCFNICGTDDFPAPSVDVACSYGESGQDWDFDKESIAAAAKYMYDYNGYTLEFSIPWEKLKILDFGDPEAKFGFDIGTIDNGPSYSKSVRGWWCNSDEATQNASLFGTGFIYMPWLIGYDCFFTEKIDFTASAREGQAPFAVQFINETEICAPNIYFSDYYLWDFGDGQIVRDYSPQHVYLEPGEYTVTLTIMFYDCSLRDYAVYWSKTKDKLIKVSASGSESKANQIPSVYSFDSAYPNPFNSKVSLRFSMPETGDVTFQIYDTAGRIGDRRDMGGRAAGNHTALWNASSFPSGAYFIDMQAGAFRARRKCVLVK